MNRSKVLIFGREPIVITNMVEGLLACLLAFGVLAPIGLDTAGEMGTIMVLVSSGFGVYVAFVTRDTLLGYLQGFAKAGIAAAAIWGWNLSEAETAGILVAIAGVLALWQRGQTGPAVVPGLNLAQHTVVPGLLEGETQDTVGAVVGGAVVEQPVAPGVDPQPPAA